MHTFSDFVVKSIALSNPEPDTSVKYMALGGNDGLIEVWNYQLMELEKDTLPY
jgi:hypothetical protein